MFFFGYPSICKGMEMFRDNEFCPPEQWSSRFKDAASDKFWTNQTKRKQNTAIPRSEKRNDSIDPPSRGQACTRKDCCTLIHPVMVSLYPGNVLRVSSFENISDFPVLSFLVVRAPMSVHGVESIFPCSRFPTYSPKASRTLCKRPRWL